ncbi:MAG: endo-1,4-beta-xylanase, partial [Lachnospiraceae bacterium]
KRKTMVGILAAAATLLLGGCAGTVEIGPVPSITPKATVTPTPSPTPTPIPNDPNRKNFIEQYEETGELPSLYETYQDYFEFGIAVTQDDVKDEKKQALIKAQFNSLSCIDELTPEYILDREATLASGNLNKAVLDFSGVDAILQFAKDNGMTVRGSALITHDTPAWFFTPDFSEPPETDSEETEVTIPLASAEVMAARMENYIKDVMEHCNTGYPGVIVCWDVLEEAIASTEGHALKYRTKSSNWYQTMGEDYIVKAFEFARKYAAAGQKLFYSELNFYDTSIRYPSTELVKMLKEKNLVDGFAVQGHWNYQSPNTLALDDVFKAACGLGVEVHVSQMDIDTSATTTDDLERTEEELLEVAAKRYKNIFSWFIRMEDAGTYDIANVTIYGLTNEGSWLNKPEETTDEETGEVTEKISEVSYPVLFDADLNPQKAFFGVLQDETIKMY